MLLYSPFSCLWSVSYILQVVVQEFKFIESFQPVRLYEPESSQDTQGMDLSHAGYADIYSLYRKTTVPEFLPLTYLYFHLVTYLKASNIYFYQVVLE
jgi:hypothetical protein